MTYDDLREYGSEAGVRAVRTGVAGPIFDDAERMIFFF